MERSAGGPADASAGTDDSVREVTAAVVAASRVFVAISARALADVDPGLTLVQLRTLVVLESRGTVKLAVLAAALGVNPSTAMRMVDRMAGLGLVDRQANPDNRREVMLSLTSGGRRVVERVMARRHEEIGAVVSRLPRDQRAHLLSALHALTDAANEPVHADDASYVG